MIAHPLTCVVALASLIGVTAAYAQAPTQQQTQQTTQQSTEGPPPEPARWGAIEENDSLYFHTDKHYTQGVRLSYLAGTEKDGSDAWDDLFRDVDEPLPFIFAGGNVERRHSLFLGQSIFTPENLQLRPPNPRDRPYAGWLYGGTSLMQRSGDMLENLELELGVVGPAALGKEVQNDWHQFIGINTAKGWQDQLQNEPGAVLSYERFWRFSPNPTYDGLNIDVVPQAGATIGNVFDYGEVGAMLRVGTHLGADFGPAHARPSLSGTDYYSAARAGDGLGTYFYIGAQGRVVAHNIFLDGNSFRQSPGVEHKTFVGDAQTGIAAWWSRTVRVDFSVTTRTEEFVGQRTPDVIGTAAITFSP